MSYKTRSNYKMGMCLPTCHCFSCRRGKGVFRPQEVVVDSSSTQTMHGGLIINTYFAPDGSRLDKPMSQTYMNHIRSRNSESIKKMKPNMGAYGA